MKPKVYVTRRLPEFAWQELKKSCQVDIWDCETSPPPYQEIKTKIRDKEGLLCLLTDQIDAELMDAAPNLKVISQCAVGYDNIDIKSANERGILVGNTPDVLTDATADLSFTLLMAGARRLGEAIDYVKAGKWKTWGLTILLGSEVYGRTLGIVGLGRIGTALAKRANGFGMHVLYYDTTRQPKVESDLGIEYKGFDELLIESDFISLHVNLTEETRGLINKRAFERMKRTAILINTSRGPVVDTEALHHALLNNQIAYACLDVTEPEPLPADHPILELPNLIVLPHIASATIESRNKMALMAVDNLIAGLNGDPLPNPVTIT